LKSELTVAFAHFAEVFPQPFEGCKLVINKGLSNHFQVSHTLQLSGIGPGAYHFGATYVGNKQTGPNEVWSPQFYQHYLSGSEVKFVCQMTNMLWLFPCLFSEWMHTRD